MYNYAIKAKSGTLRIRDGVGFDSQMLVVGSEKWVGFDKLPEGVKPSGDADLDVIRVLPNGDLAPSIVLNPKDTDKAIREVKQDLADLPRDIPEPVKEEPKEEKKPKRQKKSWK